MKIRFICLLLVAAASLLAMSGCQTAGPEISGNEPAVGTTAVASGKHKKPALTMEEAQNIALKHAGLTADQVTALHTEYEIEHGIPQYDVEFHHGTWEYDYEIHGDTGEILSVSKDDKP